MSARKKLDASTFRRPKPGSNSTSSSGHLEEYIYELESRESDALASDAKRKATDSGEMSRSRDNLAYDTSDSPDIFTQLAQKEKDLILAAELGKALLERNEELTRANEKITEEYSHKLEVSDCQHLFCCPRFASRRQVVLSN